MPRDASDASKVEVFVDEPTRPYKAIAIVEASDEAWGLSIDTLKAKLVKETAALGGDAVIIGQRVDQGAGASFIPVGNMLVGVNMTEKKLSGKVIVFTDK